MHTQIVDDTSEDDGRNVMMGQAKSSLGNPTIHDCKAMNPATKLQPGKGTTTQVESFQRLMREQQEQHERQKQEEL